jgi:glyoxylase-like metal-dependent hydrolase (beta-lactamase superfamily II)
MLIRATGQIGEEIYLLTLGGTCRYLIKTTGCNALIDPGCSAHLPSLLLRLGTLGLTPSDLTHIFLTHLHADRVGAAARLKVLNPQIVVCGSHRHSEILPLEWSAVLEQDQKLSTLANIKSATDAASPLTPFSFDKLMTPGEQLSLSSTVSLRLLATPGHTKESVSYFLEPTQLIITDELVGYYWGRELPSPGCDYSIAEALRSIQSLGQLNLSALCMPHVGVLTGALVNKHLAALTQVIEDVQAESIRAKQIGIPSTEIISQIERGLFSHQISDPILKQSFQRSAKLFCNQVQGLLQARPKQD